MRQIAFLRAGERDQRSSLVDDEIVQRDDMRRQTSSTDKSQTAAAGHRVETKKGGKRIDGVARRHGSIEHIAVDKSIDFRMFDNKSGRFNGLGQRDDQMIERRAFEPAIEPVASRPVVAVAPYRA